MIKTEKSLKNIIK